MRSFSYISRANDCIIVRIYLFLNTCMFKLLCIALLLLISCTGPAKKKQSGNDSTSVSHTMLNKNHLDTLNETVFTVNREHTRISDSVLRLQLLPGVYVHWNNNTGNLLQDSLYQKLKNTFYSYKMALANEIRNNAETGAKACSGEEKIKIGDVCFAVIDQIESLPLLELTHFQLDAFYAGCQFPFGLIELLNSHRSYMTKCVKDYLYNQSKY